MHHYFSSKLAGCSSMRGVWHCVGRLLLVLVGLSITVLAPAQQAAEQPDKYAEIPYPHVDYGNGPEAQRIKHGEYLTIAGDCISCHTTSGGKPFAGGLAIETPFGTIYSPNITPDKATGIGNWSDDDFDRAVREGISPHGEYYFPVFPYTFFNKLSRQDVLDIRAYLNAVPAVAQPNKPLDMPWPFRWRELQSFWRFMFFDFYRGEFVPDTRQSLEWNRGAYLVESLGHCSMCHSPLNKLGAPIRKYELAGGFVEGFRAPNISASALQNVPTKKVLDVFLKDKMMEGGNVQGPMLQANRNSFRYLTTSDLTDIVIYLRTVHSKIPPAPKIATGAEAGKSIYEQYCSGCHNMGGGGAPKLGDTQAWAGLMQNGISNLYQNAIHGIGGMPPKGTCNSCTDEQLHQAVDYIVAQANIKPGEKLAAPAAPPESPTSFVRGKKVYEQVCSICHAEGLLGAPKLGDKAAWEPLLKLNLDVLIERSVDGYKGHPPMGACYKCSDADIIAAVKYMAQQGGTGNYELW